MQLFNLEGPLPLRSVEGGKRGGSKFNAVLCVFQNISVRWRCCSAVDLAWPESDCAQGCPLSVRRFIPILYV